MMRGVGQRRLMRRVVAMSSKESGKEREREREREIKSMMNVSLWALDGVLSSGHAAHRGGGVESGCETHQGLRSAQTWGPQGSAQLRALHSLALRRV
jgi:hypothetical protein